MQSIMMSGVYFFATIGHTICQSSVLWGTAGTGNHSIFSLVADCMVINAILPFLYALPPILLYLAH